VIVTAPRPRRRSGHTPQFSTRSTHPAIRNTRPPTRNPDEIADALSFAVRYKGRKRVDHTGEMMARITADRLVEHLTALGFVLMKSPAAPASSTAEMKPPRHELVSMMAGRTTNRRAPHKRACLPCSRGARGRNHSRLRFVVPELIDALMTTKW
jgi:hypothetical protein